MTPITLLTDFGTHDEYVGVLKGVILSVNPNATIIDLCHHIEPQDVASAARMLKASHTFFPRGSIHAAIIDPGVGSAREIIAARCGGQIFLAPNNGLLWPLLNNRTKVSIRQVENNSLFRHPVSPTFHGRDIIGPVAGHLSKGLDFDQLGRQIIFDELQMLHLPKPVRNSHGDLEGMVVSIDRFGNLITNIPVNDLEGLNPETTVIRLQDHRIQGISKTYANGSSTDPIAVIGSRNYLEIAINRGSAAEQLHIALNAPVAVSRRY